MMNRRQFLAAVGALGVGKKPYLDNRFYIDADEPINVTRFPYMQNVAAKRASILWGTVENGFGYVEYSSDGVTFQGVPAQSRAFQPFETDMLTPFVQYQADLTGLVPDTEYVYRVTVDGQPVTPGGELRFRTPGSGPFNFVVLGDSGQGTDPQFRIATRIAAERPSLVVHTGDLAYFHGTYEQFQLNYFNHYYQAMTAAPFFPCPGNHEYETRNALPYLAVHSLPADTVPSTERGRYYSFDWGNVHFVSLDSTLSLERAISGSGSMLRWLEDDLRATRLFWRVVFFHHPPYATGPNQGDPIIAKVRDRIVPILDAHGVQVVFNGHEHSYQRSQSIRRGAIVRPGFGTVYFTSGGGGANLYPTPTHPLVLVGRSVYHYLRVEVRGTRMIIHPILDGGTEFDTFTVSPQPALTDDTRVRAVSFSPGLTAGSVVRLNGRSFAAEENFACTNPLPTRLSNVEVSVNGRPISLLYVSPTLIYGQLRFAVEGSVTARVATPNGFAETSVSVP